ncbi:uncharacterized protein RCO7_11547 [Rhynchosporium graminicola]|uniref:Uncharacterized protein n=1 Tax=Rhynchosporium graminicola TaxID=2792576 RepID=A0A1E1LLH2_9HELO|nr:uncharacterized protein RCO7_11547 [Rhynchosporium commune]
MVTVDSDESDRLDVVHLDNASEVGYQLRVDLQEKFRSIEVCLCPEHGHKLNDRGSHDMKSDAFFDGGR